MAVSVPSMTQEPRTEFLGHAAARLPIVHPKQLVPRRRDGAVAEIAHGRRQHNEHSVEDAKRQAAHAESAQGGSGTDVRATLVDQDLGEGRKASRGESAG